MNAAIMLHTRPKAPGSEYKMAGKGSERPLVAFPFSICDNSNFPYSQISISHDNVILDSFIGIFMFKLSGSEH